MTLRQSAIKHLKKDYRKIDLLEALNAFYQIRGIVVQESSKYPCRIEEAFLGLHQLFFDLIQEHFQEEDLKENDFFIQKLKRNTNYNKIYLKTKYNILLDGKKPITKDVLLKLSALYEISPAYFLGGSPLC